MPTKNKDVIIQDAIEVWTRSLNEDTVKKLKGDEPTNHEMRARLASALKR